MEAPELKYDELYRLYEQRNNLIAALRDDIKQLRTELAAKDAEIESARKSTDYWKAELYAANSEIDLLRGLLSEAVENPASATEYDGATLWRCHFCEAEMYNGGEHHEGCLVLRAAIKEVE